MEPDLLYSCSAAGKYCYFKKSAFLPMPGSLSFFRCRNLYLSSDAGIFISLPMPESLFLFNAGIFISFPMPESLFLFNAGIFISFPMPESLSLFRCRKLYFSFDAGIFISFRCRKLYFFSDAGIFIFKILPECFKAYFQSLHNTF